MVNKSVRQNFEFVSSFENTEESINFNILPKNEKSKKCHISKDCLPIKMQNYHKNTFEQYL